MGRVSKRRLSAAAFQRLRPWLVNIEVRRVHAAYLSVVEGKRQEEIAKEYKWSQQGVSNAVATVWKRVEQAIEAGFDPDDDTPLPGKASDIMQNPVTDGWVTATITAPSELVEKFMAEIAAYLYSQAGPHKTVIKAARRKPR